MRLYLEVARAAARRMSTYRGATFAGVFTNTVFGFILAYVLLAVFRARPTIGGFDAVDAVTFTFVTQGLLMVIGIFGDSEQSERILTGDVAVDLSRPYDYQAWWAAVAYGKAAFYAIFRGVPPFVLGALVLHVRVPAEPTTWLAFLASVTAAVGVAFAYGFLVELSAFWLIEIRGLRQFAWLTAQFMSGTFVPLVLLPDGIEPLVRALPFAGMVQLPVEVFLDKHHGSGLIAVYAHQLAWAAALTVAGRLALRRAVRRVEVQGG
jgi:ABC-2 type transport system permease protein